MASVYCTHCSAEGSMIRQLVSTRGRLCEEHRLKALENLAKAGTGSSEGRSFNSKVKRRAIDALMPLLVACEVLDFPVAFGTLTYRVGESVVALDVAACQRDLQRWRQRWRRIYPDVLMFWYPELTRRGAVFSCLPAGRAGGVLGAVFAGVGESYEGQRYGLSGDGIQGS